MKSTVLAAAIVAVSITVAVSNAHAHDGATGIVKERMELMEDLGKSMKSFSRIIKGRDKYDAGKLLGIARQLKLHGGGSLTQLFSSGSLMKPSNAILEIWQDWDQFSELAETLRREANQLEKDLLSKSNGSIQENSIATKQSFKKIARTCSSCHRDFRKKKK
jgi:cytochrome c556